MGVVTRGMTTLVTNPRRFAREWKKKKHYVPILLLMFSWSLSFHAHALVFICSRVGREYGVGRFQKIKLVWQFRRNVKKIRSGSTWGQHMMMAEELLRIPATIEGDVVECGCFGGAASASLSLVCKLIGRKLYVCDSFEGLPELEEDDKEDVSLLGSYDPFKPNRPLYRVWVPGDYSASLDYVKNNVDKYGAIESCVFVKGFFKDTMPDLPAESLALVFEDADLVGSVRDCIEHLWPKLQEGCRFYCHEPWSVGVVGLFYDNDWWRETLNAPAPGFQGSGGGTKIAWSESRMGYAQKLDFDKIKQFGFGIDAGHDRSIG